MTTIWPVLIAVLVVSEVGLWQWRMVIAHRGNRTSAMLLGALGAFLQITAISQVVADIHDPWSVGAYAAGVGVGVLLGLIAGDRLTPGLVGVTIITAITDPARQLWARVWPATAQQAQSEDGPVTVLFLAINRRHAHRLHRDVATLDPDAEWSVEDVRARSTQRAPVPV